MITLLLYTSTSYTVHRHVPNKHNNIKLAVMITCTNIAEAVASLTVTACTKFLQTVSFILPSISSQNFAHMVHTYNSQTIHITEHIIQYSITVVRCSIPVVQQTFMYYQSAWIHDPLQGKKKRKCYEMYWDSGTEKKKRVKLGYSIKSFTTHPTYLKFRVGLNTNCKLLKKWWGRAPVSVKFCCFVWQLLWRSRAILK